MSRPNTLISTRIEDELAVLTRIAKERCMYKVHEELRDVNKKAYKPTLLAIGPYHHGNVGQGFMEEHKLRYLQQMLKRTKGSVETYITTLRELEEPARKYYAAECISQIPPDEFVKMMLLDGCFIIELFHRYNELVKKKRVLKDDPIFQMKWVLPRIARDLLLFENQLPFFILTELFRMSESNETRISEGPINLQELIINIQEKHGIRDESSTSTDQIILKQLNDLALGFFSAFFPFQWNVNNSTERITDLVGLATHETLNPSLRVMICERLDLGLRFKNADRFEHLLSLIHATICISILDTEIDHAKQRREAGVKFNMDKIFGPIRKAVTSAKEDSIEEPLVGASLTREPLDGASLPKEPRVGASLTKEPCVGASLFKEPLGGASLTKEPLGGASLTKDGASLTKEQRVGGASLTKDGASLFKEPLGGASLTKDGASLFKEPLGGASLTKERRVGANLFKALPSGESSSVELGFQEQLKAGILDGTSSSAELGFQELLDGISSSEELGFQERLKAGTSSSAELGLREQLIALLDEDGTSSSEELGFRQRLKAGTSSSAELGFQQQLIVLEVACLSPELGFQVDIVEKWKHLNCSVLLEAGVELTKASEFRCKLDEIRRWIKIPYAIELQEAGIEIDTAEKFERDLLRDQNRNKEQKSKLMPGVESKNAEKLKRLLCKAGVDINKAKKFERRLADLRGIEHRNIHGATELEEAGIKFKKSEKDDAFSIKFNNGLMEISPLSIVDETETYLRNLIAYEQYYDLENGFNYVTNYVCFMDDLINSPKDVELLRRSGIIRNYLGDDEVVSTVVNKLCHNITISPKSSIYARTSVDLNMHCSASWNLRMAKLRHDYFNSPWALVSFLAAVLLLLLTITQTVFSIIP